VHGWRANLRTAHRITFDTSNVRYGSKADIQRYPLQCPLLGAKRTLNRPATRISLRDYESTGQRVEFLWKFAEGKVGSRELPGLFSRKSRSTRGCNRSRDAPEDARPVICRTITSDSGIFHAASLLMRMRGEDAALDVPIGANVRVGSKADINTVTHLRPLSGVKQTLNVCFQGAMQFSASECLLIARSGHSATNHRHQKPSCPSLMFRPTLANGFGWPINLSRAKL